ncbi:hypothetical protein BK120_00535 [Paenibacillus sp. FSL A5-0031]|uniref:NPCBM/NEW2 domain-containing protein n=1 Tax=Paenibacillus sp. FSL A5-0031 TaxID=1920420 RepID=UPI00096D380C|nr:NPCBM/NEW2 domain-containing protein [Paenibacillus sp. FSL A5-0031]OME87853.1 hypothetical protein BK120_00535 [Paenibacillus sp. FSL A5-0031]
MSKKISTCIGLIFVLLFITVSPVFADTNDGNTGAQVVNDIYTNQKNYVDLRFGMFIHYNMGTYHDQEWVTPGQNPLSFNPEHVNTDQWAQAAKSAGIKYSVLTTKHHDGFALWPTKYGDYNVMNSSYKKDIVRQYVDSMRAQGILPGIYFSIWDRQEGIAKGSVSRADIEFIKGQLTELLTNYGEIPVLIIDGWAWEMGHNEVPYQEIRELVKRLQPNILIVDHNGQTQPWEEDIIYFEEPKGVWAPFNNTIAANQGMPLVSNQWFWHDWMTNTEPASVENIVEDHLGYLEPRYTNFLLNISPNPDGELDDNVVKRLAEIGQAWSPNESRPPLPQQPIVMEHTITANSATATSGNASGAIDGLMDYVGTTVESVWQSNTTLPQSITLDLGYTYNNINMLNYLPSQSVSQGMITSYTLYVSEDGTNFASIKSGTWDGDNTMKRVTFPSHTARYFKLEVNSAVGGFAAAGELAVGSYTNEVPTRTGIDSFDVNTLYRFVNKATGKVLGVGNSLTNGAAVAGRTQSDALDQQWVIDDLGLGKYKIVNKHSGQVMDVPGASKSPGNPVIQWTDSETAADPTVINQQWAISNVGNGYFKITSVNSGLALENSNGSDADGNPVLQNMYTGSDRQLWKVERLPSLIKNVKVNGVLVKGLNAENRSATLTVLREKNLEVPTVTVDKASEDVQLVIDPADSLPGATTITATADGGATQEVYTLNFELVDRYASDLEWLNASSGWSTVKKDKSLDGNAIRLMGSNGAITYEKGFGVHAESRIIFDISDKNYESFNALVGVDQEMTKSSSYADVEFKVLVDGAEKFASGQMKLTDVAKPVDVNVVGSSIVELVVTQSDSDNSEDHASWANAMFRIANGKSELKEELPEVNYLSDLDWVSAESGWSTVKRDKSIDGNAIVLKNGDQDLSFGKGLGTHANSSIKYDLTGADYETFSAFIGVDKEVNGGSNNGSIQFKVSVVKNDDTIESLYSGDVLRESQNAQFVKVHVRGYKQLILEVTDSGNGNSEDHGDWADAKLTVGASMPILTQSITVSSASDSLGTKGGTLQLSAAVLPADATNKVVTWAVYEADGTTVTDKATISAIGLLTAVKDGAVKIVATAADGSAVTGSKVITISGQSKSDGGNGGGNNGGGGSTTESSVGDPAVYESKGSELSVDIADNTVKAELDAEAFMKKVQAFEQAGDNAGSVLSIKVSGSYAGYEVIIPAEAVNRLAGSKPNAVIKVTSSLGSYAWQVSELTGKGLDPNGQVIVRIGQTDPAVQKVLEEKLAGSDTRIRGAVVGYEAGLKEKGATTELKPTGYVERTLIADGAVSNPNEATVVKYDPATGELRFVPAVFTVKDGKTRATIQHNENGLYVILEGKKTFADMQGHWAQQAVEALASKLIVKGKTETAFDPNGQVTRAEFASLLVRSLGLSSKGSDQAFTDVAASSWYAADVNAAVQHGLVQGVGNNKFNPDAFITREQMAVMIMKAVQLVQGDTSAESNSSSNSLAAFADQDQLSGFAREAVQAVINAGIMNGKSETAIAPKDTASRAQTAVMLKRALSFLQLINP